MAAANSAACKERRAELQGTWLQRTTLHAKSDEQRNGCMQKATNKAAKKWLHAMSDE
jgi:hypothetical protein